MFTLYTAAIDGVGTTDSGEVADFLYLLFVACDQKVEDLSVLLADPMEMEGAATAGGFRSALFSMMDDSYRLNFYYSSSGSGEAVVSTETRIR